MFTSNIYRKGVQILVQMIIYIMNNLAERVA